MADTDVASEELASGDGLRTGEPLTETTRTELVWPGKYDENGKIRVLERVALPFQVIERVNESRAARESRIERGLTLFEVWKGNEGESFEEGWRNKLIWGDNKLVMSSLLEELPGKIDFIYIDPPFATGTDFSFTAEIGEDEESLFKEQSAVEEKAYRDTWGRGIDSYVAMMSDRLRLMHDLLSPRGTICVHCDWHVNHFIRQLLDETFGEAAFVNEIVWHYFGFKRKTAKNFPRKHDTLLLYGRGDERSWTVQYKPHRPEYVARFKKDAEGRLYRDDVNPTGGGSRVIYLDEVPGDIVDSVWDDIPPVNPVATERWNFPTQKPEALLERLIRACTGEGALVADFFCGSGTTMAVAEKLGRRWVGCDLGRYGIHVSRKRLLGADDCRPFEILNLGRYERRYWQVATFGEDLDHDGVISLFEYVTFILKLYGATPTSGLQHLHGKLGSAFVHVGAVDAPVTIGEVGACVEECVALKASELHVLGWEWEMGMNDLVSAEAKRRGVKVVLRQIPREVMEEQAAAKGDVKFFELAYLEARIEPTRHELEFIVELENFVIPNPELVPDEVREKITKWSDYVDYWAVDWDFRDDTFMQGWVTYRTRRNRTLELRSDPHVYGEPGEYAVMVKVIDVFGNDTSTILRLTVE